MKKFAYAAFTSAAALALAACGGADEAVDEPMAEDVEAPAEAAMEEEGMMAEEGAVAEEGATAETPAEEAPAEAGAAEAPAM